MPKQISDEIRHRTDLPEWHYFEDSELREKYARLLAQLQPGDARYKPTMAQLLHYAVMRNETPWRPGTPNYVTPSGRAAKWEGAVKAWLRWANKQGVTGGLFDGSKSVEVGAGGVMPEGWEQSRAPEVGGVSVVGLALGFGVSVLAAYLGARWALKGGKR
jgi:hypothetical protein